MALPPRNPPRPVEDDLQGAHHQAGEIPDELPERVNEALHGLLPPPMQDGMPGLQSEGLRGEVPRSDRAARRGPG